MVLVILARKSYPTSEEGKKKVTYSCQLGTLGLQGEGEGTCSALEGGSKEHAKNFLPGPFEKPVDTSSFSCFCFKVISHKHK